MANLPLIVLIGDSIRMGYQDHVVSQLAGRAEVWSPKENGGDSRNVLAHLDQWAFSRQRLCCMKGRFFVSALVEKKQVPQ